MVIFIGIKVMKLFKISGLMLSITLVLGGYASAVALTECASLKAAADAGNAADQVRYGQCLADNTPREYVECDADTLCSHADYRAGEQWFSAAAQQNNAEGWMGLAHAHFQQAEGMDDAYQAGMAALQAAMALGSTQAVYEWARVQYFNGETQLSKEAADAMITALTQAAQAGNYNAERMLGIIYAEGKIVPMDLKKADALFESSAKMGGAPAIDRLMALFAWSPDWYYLNPLNDGSEMDEGRFYTWLERAAEAGNVDALERLLTETTTINGTIRTVAPKHQALLAAHLANIVNSSDPSALMKTYEALSGYVFSQNDVAMQQQMLGIVEKAANLNHDPALYHLGGLYEMGTIVSQNADKAHALYERIQSPEWQYNVAIDALMIDDPTMQQQGLMFLKKAAAGRYPRAMMRLSRYYINGEGVAQDLKQALHLQEGVATSDDVTVKHELLSFYLDQEYGDHFDAEKGIYFAKLMQCDLEDDAWYCYPYYGFLRDH